MIHDLAGMEGISRMTPAWHPQSGLGRVFALAMVLAAMVASPALAHKTSVFAAVQGKTISGEAYFRDGTPVRGARVTAFDPDGKPLAETQTDSQGKFSVPIARRCNHRLVVDAGDGHMAEYLVHAEEIPADLPGEKPSATAAAATAAPAAKIDPAAKANAKADGVPREGQSVPASDALAGVRAELEALRTQLVQLRRDLAEKDDRARWSDVLGGIGYIIGLTGFAFYFLGASLKKKTTPNQPEPTSAQFGRRLESPP